MRHPRKGTTRFPDRAGPVSRALRTACPACRAPLDPATISEDAPLDPRNTYAATKVAQEHLAIASARAPGRSVTPLRYGDTPVRTCWRSTPNRSAFVAYNVASGTPHTVGEMATGLASAVGAPMPVTTGEYRLADVHHVVASPRRAKNELGFAARVDFADGMADFATASLR